MSKLMSTRCSSSCCAPSRGACICMDYNYSVTCYMYNVESRKSKVEIDKGFLCLVLIDVDVVCGLQKPEVHNCK